MKSLTSFFALIFLILATQISATAQTKTYDIANFDTVVINPHIQVTFVKGDATSVVIESSTEPLEKLTVEVDDNTLELYLEGARIYTKSKENDNGRDRSLYKGTVIKATITYKNIEDVSLRGEEKFVFESDINQKKFEMSIYGESQVYLNEVHISDLKVATYGESFIKLESGKTGYQLFRAYGESKINTMGVDNEETKLTAYGEGTFQFNVSDELKVTSYGEPTVTYKGNAKLKRALSFGDATVTKVN